MNATTLIAFLLLCSFLLINMANIYSESDTILSDIQPSNQLALKLDKQIEHISSSMSLFLLTKDEKYKQAFIDSFAQAENTRQQLAALTQQQAESSDALTVLQADMQNLEEYKDTFIALAASRVENEPAFKMSNETINPLFREIQFQSGLMLESEQEEYNSGDLTRLDILNTINAFRYTWLQASSSLRAFLAFRGDPQLVNLHLYLDQSVQHLDTIANFGERLTFEEEDALSSMQESIASYQQNIETLIKIHQSPQWRQDLYLIETKILPLLDTIAADSQIILQQQQNAMLTSKESSASTYNQSQIISLLFILVVALFTLSLVHFVAKKIIHSIQHAIQVAENISAGELNNQIEVTTNDESGQLLVAFASMQLQLSERNKRDQKQLEENIQIRNGLDSASTPVMVTSNDHRIMYANHQAKAMIQMLSDEDNDFAIPAEQIIGSSVSVFGSHTLFQDHFLDTLSAKHQATETLFDHIYSLNASPINNSDGKRIGTVFEWLECTQEKAIESEIQRIIQASEQGDLSQRINLHNQQGFYRTISDGINRLSEQMSNIMNDLSQLMTALSNGDLRHTINNNYQGDFANIINNANTGVSKLRNILSSITDSNQQVNEAIHNIVQNNQSLSHSIDQQSRELEQTSATLEEISSTVQNNAEKVEYANQKTSDVRHKANHGGEVLSDAIDAMAKITASSKEIEAIVGVMNAIAFQTKLLSLNASVEAARAGEQGRGFSVVATEVRNLAERSGQSAKEISQLIKNSLTRITEGEKLVNSSGDILKEMIQEVQSVSKSIEDISHATHEQATGIQQINQSVTNIDNLAKNSVLLAENANNSSETSQREVANMNDRIAFFHLK